MRSTSPVSLNGRNHPAPVRLPLPKRECTVFYSFLLRMTRSKALVPFSRNCNRGVENRMFDIKPFLISNIYLFATVFVYCCCLLSYVAICRLLADISVNLGTLRRLLPVLLSFWNSLSNACTSIYIAGCVGLLKLVNGCGYAHNR